MNRLRSRFPSFVVAALTALAPVFEAVPAAAQAVAARSVPTVVATPGISGAAVGLSVIGTQNAAGPINVSLGSMLPIAGVVTPIASPGVVASPVALALPAVVTSPAVRRTIASPAAVAAPAARSAIASPAAQSAIALPAAQSAVSSLSSLEGSVSIISRNQTADRGGSAVSSEVSRLFEASSVRTSVSEVPAAVTPAVRPSALRAPRLAEDAPSDEPQAPAPQAPKSSWARTARVGLVTAVLMLVTQIGIPAIAAAFGYQANPNYQGPELKDLVTGASAVGLMATIAILAPITEEAIFRGGLQKWLASKFSGSGELAKFWLPALVSSTIFVLLHETSDPVLMATRLLGSLLLARAYYREGVLSSMAAHAIYNGTLGVMLMGAAFLGGAGELIAVGALLLGMIPATVLALKKLKADKADRASGAIVPLGLTPAIAKALVGIIVAAMVVVGVTMPMMLAGGAIFWIPAAIGLWNWAKKRQ